MSLSHEDFFKAFNALAGRDVLQEATTGEQEVWRMKIVAGPEGEEPEGAIYNLTTVTPQDSGTARLTFISLFDEASGKFTPMVRVTADKPDEVELYDISSHHGMDAQAVEQLVLRLGGQ